MRARAVAARVARARRHLRHRAATAPGTFNISTVASFVVAGLRGARGQARQPLGERHAAAAPTCSRRSASASTRRRRPCRRALDAVGWTFLFAPRFHAATRHAVAPRKELGVRTAFNLLGPLTQPGAARRAGRRRAAAGADAVRRALPAAARHEARLGRARQRARRAHARRADDRGRGERRERADLHGRAGGRGAGARRRSRRCAAATRRRTPRSRATCWPASRARSATSVLLNAAAALRRRRPGRRACGRASGSRPPRSTTAARARCVDRVREALGMSERAASLGVLDAILARTRETVAREKQRRPLERLLPRRDRRAGRAAVRGGARAPRRDPRDRRAQAALALARRDPRGPGAGGRRAALRGGGRRGALGR